MAFWTSFAKQVLLRVLNDGVRGQGESHAEMRRCTECGRMARAEALRDGRCFACRLKQEREEEQRGKQERDSESNRSQSSADKGTDLARAYQVLECKASDSDAEIKKKYRALVKECHVDSLPKDLPDYLVKAANKRFVEVQDAYDLIRNARNMA